MLQAKVEDLVEQLRQERIVASQIQSDMINKETLIEQQRSKLKQLQADLKIVNLENEALIKQINHEKEQVEKQLKDHKAELMRSPLHHYRKASAQAETTAKARNNESYVDYSYTQSPSLAYRSVMQEEKAPAGYNYSNFDKEKVENKKQSDYNQQVIRNIENRAMRPLAKSIGNWVEFKDQILPPKAYQEDEPILAKAPPQQRDKPDPPEGPQEQKPKRTNSADPTAGSRNPNQGDKQKETYIQKLLGLNRTNSSTSSKYHNKMPTWQKLLKQRQEAEINQNSFGRKLSFGRDSNGSEKYSATVQARQHSNISMGDIHNHP